MKSYDKESDKGNFLEVDVQYLEKLRDFHNDLPFLPERMKIKKVEKLVAISHDKTEYVIHISNLNQALKTEKKEKSDFEKDFLMLMKTCND